MGPIQFAVCYGAVVACTLLGGQCMKVILNSCNTHVNRDPHFLRAPTILLPF